MVALEAVVPEEQVVERSTWHRWTVAAGGRMVLGIPSDYGTQSKSAALRYFGSGGGAGHIYSNTLLMVDMVVVEV